MQRHMRLCLVQLEPWHTGIEVLAKAIRHYLAHVLTRLLVAIQTYRTEDGEGAQVVYAAHMVVMYMGQQYGVQRFEGQRHQLLAYVRTAIYQHSCCVCLYQRHTTRALVAWVVAAAYLAVASKRRHST